MHRYVEVVTELTRVCGNDDVTESCFELFSRRAKLHISSSISLDLVFRVFPEVGFEVTCGMNEF
jgi:hypothetical protein